MGICYEGMAASAFAYCCHWKSSWSMIGTYNFVRICFGVFGKKIECVPYTITNSFVLTFLQSDCYLMPTDPGGSPAATLVRGFIFHGKRSVTQSTRVI